jgi:hypothetical protein
MTTEVTLHLTERAFRVLKGYATLSGKPIEEITRELSELVSATLDKELTARIAAELNISVVRKADPPKKRFEDITNLSDGLGDTEPEDVEGDTNEDAMVPATGGLTEDDIAKDMSVDDPRSEAKAEATLSVVDGEELFAEVAGFDQRGESRKPKRRSRGKVSALSATFTEENTL